ncbi:NPS9 [Fusarium beomiforme]|uniref:NPS9 n=1 Tax=Fusarium beomiforme TaxID=44412 RepID=A0A9P5DTT4_9HYPO|nr:NPS9 [Fusarium beomiforme]
MAPLINYTSTEVLVLDVACSDVHELGRALWSITVDLYHHRDEWTLTCLAEKHGRWEKTYRLVSIQNSTTMGQLLAAKRLIEPPKEAPDGEDVFAFAVVGSGIPVPRLEGCSPFILQLSEFDGRPTAQVLFSGKKSTGHARVLLKSFYSLWENHGSSLLIAELPVCEVGGLSYEDVRILELVNSGRLLQQKECIHDVVLHHSRRTPSEYAVRAWDGNLTYSQLNDQADRIATMLLSAGIVQGDFIPSIMEKSYWTIVVLLATLKAGAVFVPIDPKCPASRINAIFLQIWPKVYFSNLGSQMRRKLNPSVTCIDNFEEVVQQQQPAPLPPSRPDAIATCFFTSGSTGKPKGAIHDHAAICTGAVDLLGPFHMDNRTSSMHFVSPSFDVSVTEIFATLYAGGCVCVPSEQGKLNDLNGQMRSLGVTHAFLTPSVAGQVKPSEVPTLQYIMLGGEPLGRATLESLCNDVHLINAYGCTESGLWDTASERLTLRSSPSNIGQSTGPRIWIVHPSNPGNLLPFGTVGEVMVESHCLARGYIGDKPAKSGFVSAPDWRHQLFPGLEHGRFYLTGDLGSYNPDGSIMLHGRKDTQAKIRGQRIELGEIEHQYKAVLPSSRVVAEVVTIGGRTMLAAFVESSTAENARDMETSICIDSISIMSAQAARLAATPALSAMLPVYMVPEMYIPINSIPLTMSGKTDRRKLRDLAQTITTVQLEMINGVHEEKEQPRNEGERLLQATWAAVLQRKASTIGIHDHFFKIGGDSLSAMKVVAAARSRQLIITVGDILGNPTIASLAKCLKSSSTISYATKGTKGMINREVQVTVTCL